jgi:signal transduction histidine kinase
MIAGPMILVAVIALAAAGVDGALAVPLRHLYLVPTAWAALRWGSSAAGLVGLMAGLCQGLQVLPMIEREGLTAPTMDALVALITPLVVGIALGRLVDQARERGGRLDALLEIQRALGGEEPFEVRLERAVALVGATLRAEHAGLVLQADDGTLAVVGSKVSGAFRKDSAAARALATGSAILVGDLDVDPRLRSKIPRRPTPSRGLVLPLDTGGGRVGVLAIERAGDLGPAARRSARELTLHLALAVENARLMLKERRFARELEDKVDQATRRLREIDRAKSEFLSVVSHELRTPLTALQGFSELLLERVVPPDRARRYLGHVRTETQRLGRIVTDLLDLSRIEAGRPLELRPERVDLGELIERNVDLFASQHPRHRIEGQVADGLGAVSADHDAVDRMLKNLMSNAVKYSPRGGRVRVAAAVAGDRPDTMELTVEDDGVGIPAEDLPRIFDRYVRIANPETRAASGLGLGLHVVRSLAEAHGGAVEVESLPGKGSRFRLLLPAAEAEI